MEKIIVIGAGVAGLSAAIYARRCGFDVTVYEQHSIPGGMCTSWKRGGYLFEGAIHWLIGTDPRTETNKLWHETGALNDSVKIYANDVFASAQYNGKTAYLYRDFDKTAAHLCEVFPEDAAAIKKMAKDIRKISGFEMPVTDIGGIKNNNPGRITLLSALKMLPQILRMLRLGKITIGKYLSRFTNPVLRGLLRVLPDHDRANSMIFSLAAMKSGDGGYPEGGSLAMTQRMAEKLLSMGGKIIYNTKADKVAVSGGKAEGVVIGGVLHKAAAVIVTCETLSALKLFDTPPADKWLQTLKKNTECSVCTFVSVGIRAQISETPSFVPAKPIKYAGITVDRLSFYNYSKYPGHAPEGCTALTMPLFHDTYEFWLNAKANGTYRKEKEALAEQICAALIEKFPQTAGKIEVIDIATPLTYERYTGAHKGSWMTVLPKGAKLKRYPCAVKSIGGLYFAGHRLNPPGGLPMALTSGRTAAQELCKAFNRTFE